jgi:hypothetical protein
MSLGGTLCLKESKGIEEIKDAHEETLMNGNADYLKNNSGNYEKSPDTGNLQMNRIELVLVF